MQHLYLKFETGPAETEGAADRGSRIENGKTAGRGRSRKSLSFKKLLENLTVFVRTPEAPKGQLRYEI
jgi:hypothetical protein